VAAAAIAALMAMRPDDPGSEPALSRREKLARLDEALEFLSGGIATLQRAGSGPAAADARTGR
jgi:hypothetical protein